jgi:hypothetical protein
MTIKSIAEEILLREREEDAVILEIFETGSQLFTDRENDYDYIVVCKDYMQRYRRTHLEDNGKKLDIVFIDEKAVQSLLDFEDLHYVKQNVKLYNYFFEPNIRKTVYGSFDIDWSMLEHKEEYLNHLKENYANLKKFSNRHKIGKSFVHYYIILKIFENNEVEITEQMTEDIELLYSGSQECESIIQWIDSQL